MNRSVRGMSRAPRYVWGPGLKPPGPGEALPRTGVELNCSFRGRSKLVGHQIMSRQACNKRGKEVGECRIVWTYLSAVHEGSRGRLDGATSGVKVVLLLLSKEKALQHGQRQNTTSHRLHSQTLVIIQAVPLVLRRVSLLCAGWRSETSERRLVDGNFRLGFHASGSTVDYYCAEYGNPGS